jgi:hypothetical protein
MSEQVHCVSCEKDFSYESEILTGGTRNVTAKEEPDDLGDSRGVFSNKKPKLQNTLLECPHCKEENYYKVLVG